MGNYIDLGDELGDYICSRRVEIMGIYEQIYDDEENLRMHERYARKEGIATGKVVLEEHSIQTNN